MSATTNTQNSQSTSASADSTAPSPKPEQTAKALVLTAEVAVKDRSGIEVHTNSLEKAIQLIRGRHHQQPPTVELDPAHAKDTARFQQAKWQINPTDIQLLSDSEARRTKAHYRLAFHRYVVMILGEGNSHGPSSLETIFTAAQKIADQQLVDVELTSELPGFLPTRFEPREFDEDTADQTAATPAPDEEPDEEVSSLAASLVDNGEDQEPQQEAKPLQRMLAKLPQRPAKSVPTDQDEDQPSEPEDQEQAPETTNDVGLIGVARKYRAVLLTAALVAIAAIGVFVLYRLMFAGPAEPETTAGTPDWVSAAADITYADEPLTNGYDQQLWELDAETAENLSWFGAGAAYIDPDDGDLVLLDHLTGDPIASTPLNSPVEYTAEFIAGDDQAVGVRTEDGFRAITADGESQVWGLEDSDTLRISGSTPMVTTEEGDTYALLVGEESPVEVTGNPQLHSAAIDDDTLIQVAGGQPTVVTIPLDEDSDRESTELSLEAPDAEAEFGQHITAGHGHTLSSWQYQGTEYLVVHSLEDDGQITAAVEAPEDVTAWSIGRGMDLAIVGPHAFDLETGELVVTSETAPLISALGPVAVTDGDDRQFIYDAIAYTETQRIIGYTGQGTALVRMPDGSVRGLGESQGQV